MNKINSISNDFNVDKVILGTAAVENIEFLKKACDKFPNKIALSLDTREGYIALSGWKKQTDILASDFIRKIKNINISRIIYTDINKDGTKSGPNLQETVDLSKLTKIPFVVSGGVSSINDVQSYPNLGDSCFYFSGVNATILHSWVESILNFTVAIHNA